MRRPHPLLALVLVLAAGLLAGCDLFGSPTPTPIPPTLTPSPTPVPPTATPQAMTTPGSGGALATAAAEGTPAAQADLDLIAQAITATRGLRSYHLVVSLDAMGEQDHAEGDFQAPDRLSLTGDLAGREQIVIIGNQTYVRDEAGNWSLADPAEAGMGDIAGFSVGTSADLFGTIAPFITGATRATSLGSETVGGTQLSHLRVPIFAGSLMGLGGSTTPGEAPIGYGDLWIDPATKHIHRLTANLDLTDLLAAFMPLMPTPGPGEPTPTPLPEFKFNLDMAISAHNIPVTIDTPPVPATPTAGSDASP